jgi:sulfite reductase (NADPH) flavoprotein alpha-component
MTVSSLRAENSPFNSEQADQLNRLIPTLSDEQLIWLGGYLVGIRARPAQPTDRAATVAGTPSAAASPSVASSEAAVTILFASQTGNAMRLAGELAQRLERAGCNVSLSCMSEFRTSALKKIRRLLVVASTHGEGEPPDKARIFHEFLHGKRAPRLEGLRFSVLALGDLSYKHFCQIGKDFDRQLEALGAERLHERVDCDVDYRETAEGWMEAVVRALGGDGTTAIGGSAPAAAAVSSSLVPSHAAAPAASSVYSREHPFHAEVLENFTLNGRGSDKETRFLKLSLEESGFSFAPGDSLGIFPENQPSLVDEFIAEMRWNADELVPAGKDEMPLRDALLKRYEITRLTRPLLKKAAEFSRDGLHELVERRPEQELDDYIEGRDLVDLARDFSLVGIPPRDFVRGLRRIPARLYSISSSCQANPGEVDLTISVLRYRAHQRERFGTCSSYCAERLREGDRVAVYVSSNPNFRMPADPDVPIIMVGAGTGVAPFRAFLEDREEAGAGGRTWLIFGDRHFRTDFLYQLDWLRWRKQGVLTRMDIAFSRDESAKVYVQHRMLERSRELYAWLQEGACFYVCGDEKRMARDVDAALKTIVAQEGRMSDEQAGSYLDTLRQHNRYQRDVY